MAAIALTAGALAGCADETKQTTQPSAGATVAASTGPEQQPPEVDGVSPAARRLVGTGAASEEAHAPVQPRDGTFAIDTSRLDAPYAFGTYELGGSNLSFVNADAGACTRSSWTWEAGITEEGDWFDDELHILFVEGGCLVPAGTQWSFARVQ